MKEKKEDLANTPQQDPETEGNTNNEGETKKESTPAKKGKKANTPQQDPETEGNTKSAVSDAVILKAKKLNPQYKKFYVNSKGFVYTVGTPKGIMGDAVLVENELYQN